jgi:hypothetical protein
MRLLAAVSLGLPLAEPHPAAACPVIVPDRAELVRLERGSMGPLELEVHGFDGEGGGSCSAYLIVLASQLPSLRLAPRPIELAEAVAPVARRWKASECTIAVELVGAEAAHDPDDACWVGTYRYDETTWRPQLADRRCADPPG